MKLQDVQKITKKASKPGNLMDYYIKIQDINTALDDAEKELDSELIFFGKNKVIKIYRDYLQVKIDENRNC